MVADVVELDDFRPHSNAKMHCQCGYVWIATYPSVCNKLECPSCSTMVIIQED
jgi:hypothetical protein